MTVELFRDVGISMPGERVDAYAWQLSGGLRQRAMIAMALSCRPRLLIADEPTTAIDVTTQAQILNLLRELQRRHGTAIVFITHDLGVIAQIAHHVVVMYLGRVMEQGPVDDDLPRPQASLHARAARAPSRAFWPRPSRSCPRSPGSIPHPLGPAARLRVPPALPRRDPGRVRSAGAGARGGRAGEQSAACFLYHRDEAEP